MEALSAYLLSATSGLPVEATYLQDLTAAVANAAVLFTLVLVIYLVFRATYLVVKLFTQAAFYLTTVIFLTVVLIGWLNR